MKLVARNGKLLEDHETSLNSNQVCRFEEALHWYEKATEKIARRYNKEEEIYAKPVALALDLSLEIDRSFKKVLNGESTVGEFKEIISAWFYKVKEGMDEADIEN